MQSIAAHDEEANNGRSASEDNISVSVGFKEGNVFWVLQRNPHSQMLRFVQRSATDLSEMHGDLLPPDALAKLKRMKPVASPNETFIVTTSVPGMVISGTTMGGTEAIVVGVRINDAEAH